MWFGKPQSEGVVLYRQGNLIPDNMFTRRITHAWCADPFPCAHSGKLGPSWFQKLPVDLHTAPSLLSVPKAQDDGPGPGKERVELALQKLRQRKLVAKYQ